MFSVISPESIVNIVRPSTEAMTDFDYHTRQSQQLTPKQARLRAANDVLSSVAYAAQELGLVAVAAFIVNAIIN